MSGKRITIAIISDNLQTVYLPRANIAFWQIKETEIIVRTSYMSLRIHGNHTEFLNAVESGDDFKTMAIYEARVVRQEADNAVPWRSPTLPTDILSKDTLKQMADLVATIAAFKK